MAPKNAGTAAVLSLIIPGVGCRRRRAQADKGSSVNSLSRHSVNADYPLMLICELSATGMPKSKRRASDVGSGCS